LPLKTDEAETEHREIELHNAAIRKRIEEMQRNRDEKTRSYSEQLRIEKLGKAPADIRAALIEALATPEAQDRGRDPERKGHAQDSSAGPGALRHGWRADSCARPLAR